ncbi:uncharacterized protein LOC143214063 isoform X2 [Lasioglossum baleicum]|uniref:uncharacterized protein LOC143214063 isoform X2 n=1 Tax=Lasioglossum baleicum TaxID=434251 RepID=UPI003FCC8D43
MSISALDSDTVKLITTTQIITSVWNAAKELIENALDANANSVEVNLIDNGTTLIEVKDDGCGITKADARYMALPAYTSKISNFSDLDFLETYGFRGEALYALSAVSDLTIISKTEDEEAATSYTFNHHGSITKSEHCHRATGTTVQVRQLFKQMPVRRQIITNPKKANQDLKILESFIKSFAMCKFAVRMSYKVDSNVVFTKPSTSTLEEAVSFVLGKKVTSRMAWANTENEGISMKIMLPLRESQNASDAFQSGAQYIFVNSRPVRYKDLEKVVTKTILEAFEYDSLSKKKPVFLLYILTSPANIDANLEPNKTSILFKEQQVVHDTLNECIKEFYGIQAEVQSENVCETSMSDYLDYTQRKTDNNAETEWPACKKRKLLVEEGVDVVIEKRTCALEEHGNAEQNFDSIVPANSENNKQVETAEKGIDDHNKNNDVSEKNLEDFNIRMPNLNLSESDSNDSQHFTLMCSDNDVSCSSTKEKTENDDDSPPFEIKSQETLSQLPVVDLGEDFDWNDSLIAHNADTSEKENKMQNENEPYLQQQNKSDKKKCVTLLEWSKGHVPGLKGSTDVQPCANTRFIEPLHGNVPRKNVCNGFIKFSTQIRSKVVEQNPDKSAAQIAQILAGLWKKLSSEERGYYRDLASDEKIETNNEENCEKGVVDNKKVRNRLLKVLGKIQASSSAKQENLVLRTIVPWEMSLNKVTENFLNNSPCTNDNLIVGIISSELYIVHKCAHIWLLNAVRLKQELNVPDSDINEKGVTNMEELLGKWFSTKDDLSLLHPLHSLPPRENP